MKFLPRTTRKHSSVILKVESSKTVKWIYSYCTDIHSWVNCASFHCRINWSFDNLFFNKIIHIQITWKKLCAKSNFKGVIVKVI